MEYRIVNRVYKKYYDIYIKGYTSQDEFHFLERTQRQELEIIRAAYKNPTAKKDIITVPIFKVYESNIFRFIERQMLEGSYKTKFENKVKLDTLMTGCIIHLKVPEYYKYNSRTGMFDIRTDEYSLFAYELDNVELHSDIDGKLQRIVEPHLI